MKHKITIGLAIGLFLIPSWLWAAERHEVGPKTKEFHQQERIKKQEHMRQQHQEDKEFYESLKGMSGQERKEAIKQHHQTQRQEFEEFRRKRHQENTTFLMKRLKNNKKLTDAQKEELINYFEGQCQKDTLFRQPQHAGNVTFFEKIANDQNMTMEQKKQAIRAHIHAQRQEGKHDQEQRREIKEKLHHMHHETATEK